MASNSDFTNVLAAGGKLRDILSCEKLGTIDWMPVTCNGKEEGEAAAILSDCLTRLDTQAKVVLSVLVVVRL